jgi:hypothetical protein
VVLQEVELVLVVQREKHFDRTGELLSQTPTRINNHKCTAYGQW